MATANVPLPATSDAGKTPFYLVFDTESVPDGKLLRLTKYADGGLTDAEAVTKAQAEARELSAKGSDFIPASFQYPVAVCVVFVAADFTLQEIKCLDAPEFRPSEIVKIFWRGVARYPNAQMVTFNGRGFDLPLLELAAFRYGCSMQSYFQRTRDRYRGNHLDLLDWMSNYGASRIAGGLNLLAKILGKPGKMEVAGDRVYAMHLEGQRQAINDYCMFDTLDTYFAFLRTRVMAGAITLEREQELVRKHAKEWLAAKVEELPALKEYLENWGDWVPWP